MVRVAHLTTAHPRFDVRIFHKECCSLARAGYSVDLYVADGAGNSQHEGVSIIDVGRHRGRINRMFGKTWAVWNAVRKTDARVIHIHDPELLPVALVLKYMGHTVIYDAHEDVPRQILSKPWIKPWIRHAIAWPFEKLENFVARRCAVVICATPHIAERYTAMGINSVAINNYPIPGELANPYSRPPRRTNERSSHNKICYIGGITRMRGAVEMLEAIAHTDMQLVLAGPMESPELHATLMAMPGWAQVDYRGVLDRHDIKNLLAESNLGLVLLHPAPNYLDALPVKMFEYMAAGVPILASDFPLWRDILNKSGAGRCVNPLDIEAIADAILSLLSSPSDLEAMGAAGVAATTNIYNWHNEERKLLDAYRQIVAI